MIAGNIEHLLKSALLCHFIDIQPLVEMITKWVKQHRKDQNSVPTSSERISSSIILRPSQYESCIWKGPLDNGKSGSVYGTVWPRHQPIWSDPFFHASLGKATRLTLGILAQFNVHIDQELSGLLSDTLQDYLNAHQLVICKTVHRSGS